MPGYEANNWYAIMAPGGLSPILASRIATDTAKVTQLPEVRDRMEGFGKEARSMLPGEFAAYVKSEIVKWGKVVKAAGVKPDQ